MSFKDKFAQQYAKSYLKKYGDRLTQVQGNIVSVKIEEKCVLWIFHKLIVTIFVRPDRSKSVQKCVFRKNRWFKKPEFISLTQGNLVIIQGMKGKKGKEDRETMIVMNVRNLTTKKDLIPIEGKAGEIKRVQKVQRMK